MALEEEKPPVTAFGPYAPLAWAGVILLTAGIFAGVLLMRPATRATRRR